MKTILQSASLVLAMAMSALAQPAYDGFATGQTKDYFSATSPKVTFAKRDGQAGKHVVVLPPGTQATLKDIPVDPRLKYALTYRATYVGGESIEENPYFDQFARMNSQSRLVPGRDILFFDAQGKPLLPRHAGMPWRAWHGYQDVFYPPTGATTMRITFRSGNQDITTYVDDVKVHANFDEGSINPNPVVGQYGPHNYSAWHSLAGGAAFFKNDTKQEVFDTKYGTRSYPFPLPGPGKYKIISKGQGNGYNTCVLVHFYDKNDKDLGVVRTYPNSREVEFTPPPETTHLRLLIYSVVLQEVRVNKVN